jgi:hypothetical protein
MEKSSDNLSPHACARCKQSHKKCDRVMPICYTCRKQNVECNFAVEYVAPKKRGRKPKGEKMVSSNMFTYEPYPVSRPRVISPSVENVSNISSIPLYPHLEMHFEDQLRHTPFFDRAKAEAILNDAKNGNNFTQSTHSNEELALYFSLKGKKHNY